MFFIAEIGSNWIDFPESGFKFLKDIGVDAIKFQMWKQKDLYPDRSELKKFEFNKQQAEWHSQLAHENGLIFLCSPFYSEAVDILEDLKVPMYKIASRTAAMQDAESEAVLDAVAQTRKPVIISMGYGGDKKHLKDIFKNNKVFWLYCKSDYPAKLDDYNEFKTHGFDGISDHTRGITLPLHYHSHHPDKIIEKHVKLEDNDSPDSPFSITTQELQDFMILSKSSSLKFG